MPNCNVQVKCRYGIGNVCRYNVLVDGSKYSKVFNCTDAPDVAKQDAEDACNAGLLDLMWEAGWRDECPSDKEQSIIDMDGEGAGTLG